MKTNFTFIRYSISVLSLMGFCGIPALSRADQADGGSIPGLRGELLYPTRTSVATDKADCAAAFRAYLGQADPADVSGLTGFLEAHADSPYRMGVLTHLGSIYFRTARFSKCIEAYEQAWTIGQGQIDPGASQTAGKAAGELALMYARLGRYESLEALLKAAEGRTFGGAGPNLLDDARLGFGLMTQDPGISFRCGPMALSRILASHNETLPIPAPIRDSVSTRQGMSLVQTRDIAKQVGLGDYRMARRAPGAAILTPAVVHWKVGHYSALLGKSASGKYRVEDPTFASQTPITISPEALDAEASGYFLVAVKDLPEGWSAIDDAEGAKVFGKGNTGGKDPNGTHGDSPKAGPNGDGGPCKGMASWAVHTSVVSLNIMDTPLGYQPPVGYPVSFTLTYNSRESQEFIPQPITDTGGRWMMNTTAYLSDLDGTGVNVFPGTGARNYYKWNANTSTYTRDKRGYSKLEKLGQDSYRVTYADGSQELYAYAAWGWDSFSREFFRTSLKDPAGNETRFEYERFGVQGFAGEFTRLKKIIDAIGGETVFQYTGNKLDPSRVTDPFGRFAEFEYDGDGHLILIRDVIGIESRFRYQGVSDLIEALITPYGETKFEYGESGTTRWLQATHPNGDHERVEFRHKAEGIARSLPQLPAGMLLSANYMDYRNALYWDRKAMKEAPGDVNSAHITHFLHTQDTNTSADLIESEKSPLEGRIFYNYRGQTSDLTVPATADTRVTKAARLLDNGSTQLSETEYNDFGTVTKTVDPVGRTTFFVYDPNQIDLLEIRQKTGAATYDVLATFTYNPQHQPLTISDAGSNVSTFTYNGRGQALTITDATNQTTVFVYDGSGRLLSADGPLPGTGDKGTFGYDAIGRLSTITDGSGLSVSLEYDALDRLVKKTYPDNEFDQWTYEFLDLKTVRQRGGAVTNYKHNSLRELVEITDLTNRRTLLEWCRCGDLKSVIDPLGKMTRFTHDVQGRVTSRINADGTTAQMFFQPVSGQPSKVIDETGRELNFAYNVDGTYATLTPGGIAPATPAMSMTWDAFYPRRTQVTMGGEITAFTYVPPASGQKGIGNLVTVDGPAANDTLAYVYDTLGRVASMSINGVSQSYSRDGIGRLTSLSNSLGNFSFTYDGSSNRMVSANLPNGQTLERLYSTGNSLRLLKDIVHRNPASQVISKFSYTYNTESKITSLAWQFDGGSPLADTPGYDPLMRLTSYQKGLAGGGSKSFAYGYDSSDNRISESIGGVPRTESPDLMNALVTFQPASGGDRNYEWDGSGRLAAFTQGSHRSEFSYNSSGQRTRIVEKEANVVTVDRHFLWVGFVLAEERDAGGAVMKRFFPQGFTTSAGKFFYTRDHLDSIREVTDESGTVRARYDYDPYGRRTKIAGDIDADFGFSGHFHHVDSGLVLTYARAYDPNFGRWISRDPTGLRSGINAYCYVGNDPLNRVDPLGLDGIEAAFNMGPGMMGDLAAHAAFDGAHAAGTNPQNIGSALSIGVTLAALPEAAVLASVAGVASIGLSAYNIVANTYGDVGKQFGVNSDLTGSVPVDLVRQISGGAGKWPVVERVAYYCDVAFQLRLGKPMQAAVSKTVPKAISDAVDNFGKYNSAKQASDLGFIPSVTFPSSSNPVPTPRPGPVPQP